MHTTRYGTKYTDSEWAFKQELSLENDKLNQKYQPELDAAKRNLVASLLKVTPAAQTIANLEFDGQYDYAVEIGHIVFSTEEKKNAVENAINQYRREMNKSAARQLVEHDALYDRLMNNHGFGRE